MGWCREFRPGRPLGDKDNDLCIRRHSRFGCHLVSLTAFDMIHSLPYGLAQDMLLYLAADRVSSARVVFGTTKTD